VAPLAAMSQQSFCNFLLVRCDSQPDDIQPNGTEQNELDFATWQYDTKHDFMLCRIFKVILCVVTLNVAGLSVVAPSLESQFFCKKSIC